MRRWLEQCYGSKHSASGLRTLETIAEIPDLEAEIHFRSQCDLLSLHGKDLGSAVVRFESLGTVWTTVRGYVREVTGVALPSLPHVNPTRDMSYREQFSARERELVYRRYRGDIERYGYDF